MLSQAMLAATDGPGWLQQTWFYLQIFAGFSFIIFVHELGHFAVAKWSGVRVEQFAIGFFREIVGFTKGETRYSFNLLPLGGYVKMLGQEDFEVDTTGDLQYRDDPRSFANKPVGIRMAIVSAGVIMNLVLSLVLFMIVYMMGKEVQSPRVGTVVPGRPAAEAGIESGDIIKSINGATVDEFNDIPMTVMLAKPGVPLKFEIERDGETKFVNVVPEVDSKSDAFQIGIGSPFISRIMVVGPGYDPENPKHPRADDVVVSMGGVEVNDKNQNEMMYSLATDPLKFNSVVVERTPADAGPDATPDRVEIDLDPRIVLSRIDAENPTPHLLGLVPLLRVNSVEPEGRADLAGIEVGDVILNWDGIENPTTKQIDKSILISASDPSKPAEQDIPVTLRKHGSGKVVDTVVRPKVKVVPIIGTRRKPKIQADYEVFADRYLRVGSVVETMMGEKSPAAEAGIPANAIISKVNDEPIKTWVQLAEAFRKNAGQSVEVTYDLDSEKDLTTTMHIPHSLRTKLGLGPESRIVSIDGKKRTKVTRKGTTVELVVNQSMAMNQVLTELVGKTVDVTYQPSPLGGKETKQIEITDDMLIPWVGATGYATDLVFGGETMLLQKLNPFAAMKTGAKKTYFFVMQVYQVMERMIVSRTLGADKISGPVGIVSLGSRMAQAGLAELLLFLAIISANLAVINFLPLPIVDGGLMVFLIIEKIKGSPISVRVQVATQIVGLVLIATAFLFVTLQDLAR